MVKKRKPKKPSIKAPIRTLWHSNQWEVIYGNLKRGRGRPTKIRSIFLAFGEKLPKGSLGKVRDAITNEGIAPDGVYFAHDSVGYCRYAGRGNVFNRLGKHFGDHPDELLYFSFYLIKDKQHEREIETALIRVASPLLIFNERKKRDYIEPGDVRDYERGTVYFERQRRKGPRKKKALGRPKRQSE